MRYFVPLSSTEVAQAPSCSGSKSKRIYENKRHIIFRHVWPLLGLINFSSHRICNYEETGLSVVQRKVCKVISLTGKRRISLSSAERGSLVTVVCHLNECYRYICSSSSGVFWEQHEG